MAAGLGFKNFSSGEVLTAADVNGYLMQGVLVFASTAARDAAITSPEEGQFAYTKDTNGLWYYDGAAWVASGATGDIEGVTAGVGISGGGTSGTVTVTNSMATEIDAKGDLIGGTGADTFARLAVGANGSVLTADSTEATGLKWATPGSAFVGCSLGKSAQTISNNTNTAVAWTSESFDTDAFHDNSTNNTRITIPAGKGGKYSISGVIFYVGTNTNSTGNRNVAVYKNGSYVGDIVSYSAAAAGTARISLNFAIVLNLVATDYVEIFTDHTAGTTIDVTGSSAAYITYLGA